MGSFLSTLDRKGSVVPSGGGGGVIRVAKIAGGDVKSSSSDEPAETIADPFGSHWVRPQKVVKRITRTVHEDGTEVIKVILIFSLFWFVLLFISVHCLCIYF